MSFATTETSTSATSFSINSSKNKKSRGAENCGILVGKIYASYFSPTLIHTPGVLELACAIHEVKGDLFSLVISWRFWLQASIFNKDVLKNPKTGEGPEVAGKKTLEAAAASDTYASRVRLGFRAS